MKEAIINLLICIQEDKLGGRDLRVNQLNGGFFKEISRITEESNVI